MNCKFDNNAVFNSKVTATYVSTRDYFHPSLSGQKRLACVSWAPDTGHRPFRRSAELRYASTQPIHVPSARVVSVRCAAGGPGDGVFTFAGEDGLSEVPVALPRIAGKTSGPTVLVTGGIHAAVYTGSEAAIRPRRSLDPQEVRGIPVIIPSLQDGDHPHQRALSGFSQEGNRARASSVAFRTG